MVWAFSAILAACADPDPIVLLQERAEDRAGAALVDCGGPSLATPDRAAVPGCIQESEAARQPFMFWSAPLYTVEGDPMYDGAIVFWLDEVEHSWSILDHRADRFGGASAVCVVPFVDDEIQPTVCYDRGWDL